MTEADDAPGRISYNSAMKVIIDLIEDIQTVLNDERGFALTALALKEEEPEQFAPTWHSPIVHMSIDDEAKSLYLFLGQERPLQTGSFLKELNGFSNEQMMYELKVSYTQDENRIDKEVIGFGESLEEKRYFLFIDAT